MELQSPRRAHAELPRAVAAQESLLETQRPEHLVEAIHMAALAEECQLAS